ncbi:uncharacterized protein EV420DRAFT_1065316 [Desarmillaria tabescens]|uniref:RING-type domain-containing protein n=1 Tax=Armillaria tabescens TaxID=1929756 RepID=A0AA39JJJ9_ARMTA|nr:uncharacterized protein EV420DRAFT_1065316 [Desarmillaria tabescens]KAK0443085.1 hypothetical protein EV420DRAFT_1065316 [Desarmillaria tabescens]
MLTLAPGSVCDVCAEEYGPQCLPHSIPCGHVLCASCSTTIAEKTPSRLKPVCPFCREEFTANDIRLIRTDFSSGSSSGWTMPRRFPPPMEASKSDSATDLWARKAERFLLSDIGCSRTREEARRLEDKVAKVANKKCSVEEVSTLHKELEEWLTSAVKSGDQTSSLYLSAALLRAILMNHVAHSEASKTAKHTENSLKGKLDDMEISMGKLEAELRRQREQYSQKSHECEKLRTELSRFKGVSPLSSSYTASPPRFQSPASPTPPATPTPSSTTTYSPSGNSPLSRYNSLHMRSSSMSASSRPVTPAQPVRSHTPLIRSQTPSVRSQTPSVRSHTPAPPVPALPRSAIPTAVSRSQTPAPPKPPKPRRLSQSSPPKMVRSLSEEKQEMHERWIPPTQEDLDAYPIHHPLKYSSTRYTNSRLRDLRSPSPG